MPSAPLIHPSRFRSAIGLIIVVRRNVVAVLIESYFPIMVPHVNLEFPGSPFALPAVVGVTHAEITFGSCKGETPGRQEFHKQITKEQAAEMSKVCDPAL